MYNICKTDTIFIIIFMYSLLKKATQPKTRPYELLFISACVAQAYNNSASFVVL